MLSARADDDTSLIATLSALNETQTLGRYELLAPVGRGGMAIVWAARLRGTRGFGRTVAIKTMLPALSADPRFERMFLAEAEIASRIRHPNVCRIIDSGEDRGVLYLVMEWVDGEPLSNLLATTKDKGHAVPYGVAAWALAKAARGLQAAHELLDDYGEPLGIVHRDVSPHNILATPGGLVQVVDFGVAKARARSENLTRSGYIKGKAAYLAPEQVEGTEVDGRADVFALGTVLYELTTGEHPFRGATELSTLLRVCSAEPAPPPKPLDYPSELRAILDRALQKDVRGRYPAMRELATALEGYAARADVAEDTGAAFLADALGARRERRALLLREAAQKADERVERRREARASGVLHPAPSTRTATFATTRTAIRRRPARRSPTLLGIAVALVTVGVAVAGLQRRPSVRSGAVGAGPSGPFPAMHNVVPSEPGSSSRFALEAMSAGAPAPSAPAPPSAPIRRSAPRAIPAARSSGWPESRPTPSSEPAASASGAARFRDPGF